MILKKTLIPVIIAGLFISNTHNIYADNNYDDKIHFLPAGSGDAILIESNGKFALVDGAEDSDNPRGFKSLEHNGYENVVVNYIKDVAGDKNGNVELEFIVGTHAHSDHLGGLDTVVNDPKINVKKAYVKVYDESKIKDNEVKNWDNKEVYEQLIAALKKENSSIVQNISKDPFKFGDFTLQFYNTEYDNSNIKKGENENSLGLKISKGNQTVFLAGDINNYDGDEDKVAKELGKVDVLKLGHHGYTGSSNTNFLNTLKPTYSIATNWGRYLDTNTSKDLKSINSKVYGTMDNNGVILTFGKNDFDLNNYSSIKEWVSKDGKWYYKNEKNEYTTGWAELKWKNKLSRYYFDKNGVMQTGWLDLDGTWYYLRSNGEMATGWEQVGNKWYYLSSSGAMKTGWLSLNGTWYYLRSNGEMATGWEQVGNKWYYLSSSGAMKTGWLSLNGMWYYLRSNGEMATGWEQVGNKWYYLSSSGAMKTGWLDLDGTWYYLRSSGEMATGWEKVNGNWYYMYTSGKMATNTIIDGWKIDKNGVATKIK